MSLSTGPIFITGATGQLGGLIIEEILKPVENPGRTPLAAPSDLLALVRSPDKPAARALEEKGVTLRRGDYSDPAALREAMTGARTVMLISGTDIGQRVQQHKHVIDAAHAAGAERIVYTSVIVAGKSPEPIFHDHKETEDYIKASGLQYTMLRNSFYMDAYVSEIKLAIERGYYQAGGPSGGSLVSRRDIARMAAAVLATAGHAGKTYGLTGEVVCTAEEFARIATAIGGKPVEARVVAMDEIEKDYVERGYPADHMPFYLLLEKQVSSGLLEEVTSDIQDVTGAAPMSFEDFSRAELSAG